MAGPGVNSLYAFIALGGIAATTLGVSGPAQAPVAPLLVPAKAVVVYMCKHVYGVLITLSDGSVLVFTDPKDPEYISVMSGIQKKDFGVLEITPEFGCPVAT